MNDFYLVSVFQGRYLAQAQDPHGISASDQSIARRRGFEALQIHVTARCSTQAQGHHSPNFRAYEDAGGIFRSLLDENVPELKGNVFEMST